MKRAIYLVAILVLLAGAAAGQTLFGLSEPEPKSKPSPAATKIGDDLGAVKAWWRDQHGDGGETLQIVEMTPRKKPKDFEIKYDSGHPLGPYWLSCEEYLNRFRGATTDRESVLYPLRRGADGAHVFTCKLRAAGRTWQQLFVVTDEGVIYATRLYRAVP